MTDHIQFDKQHKDFMLPVVALLKGKRANTTQELREAFEFRMLYDTFVS